MIDYAAILADLRTKRDQLADLIARIEAFATPVPAPNGDHPAVDPRKRPIQGKKKAPAAEIHPKGERVKNGKGSPDKDNALRLARAGKTPKEIAAAVGRSYATVFYWLQKAGLAGPKKKAASDAVRRLCAECGQKGISDPCEHCGEAR